MLVDSSQSRPVPPLPVEVDAGGEGRPEEAGLDAVGVAVCGGSGRSGSCDGFPRKMAETGRLERDWMRGRADADMIEETKGTVDGQPPTSGYSKRVKGG